ncbi:MAG: class I SAM-dependent methyltransferase [Candidatus ainarchaeum sp.]|nr:class I SAM-dependent methyltransferase [Candidatus ainarchaeum sp.]
MPGKVEKCRICGNPELKLFLPLGTMALANSFIKREDLGKPEPKFPLNAVFCEACGLVQLDYVVPPEVLFSHYVYFSSTSETLRRHFAAYAHEIHDGFTAPGSLVVEVASNDGVLLKNLVGKNVKILGVEPATNIAEVARKAGVPTLNEFFSLQTAKRIAKEYGKASAITGNNVFAHVGDLHDFVEGLRALLAPGGAVLIEVPYLADFYRKKEFDTIYHEHLAVYSLKPLIRLFGMHGMQIFDVKAEPVQGGSIRFYAQLAGGPRKVSPRVAEFLEEEEKLGLHGLKAYEGFSRDVAAMKSRLVSMLGGMRREGKRIAAYGAAAKGNTLLNYFQIGPETIEYCVDRNPAKVGFLTPGMHIPVVGVERLAEDKPDYLLILAWNLAEEIMSQQAEYKNAGGKFIIPIPEPRIV